MARFTNLPDGAWKNTIAGRMGGVVDRLRDLKTRAGQRPYQVLTVRTRWTGGERGSGDEQVLAETVLLPTPDVGDLTRLSLTVDAWGAHEMGDLTVVELSPALTEEALTGGEIAADESFYWEVRLSRDAGSPRRRRFTVKSAPSYDASKFQWTVTLTATASTRAPDGSTVIEEDVG